MAATKALRRSNRLATKARITFDPKTHARTAIKKQRTTPRVSRKKTSSVDLEAIEMKLAEQAKKSKRIHSSVKKPHHAASHFVEESASEDSDSGAEYDSEDSEDDYNEAAPLSYDHFEYVAAYDLNTRIRRHDSIQSYDSRYESGNEEYEQDNFVVNDDESIEIEGSEASTDDSEDDFDLAINMERHPVYARYQSTGRAVRTSSLFSVRRRSSAAISPKTARQSSHGSDHRRRSSSQLFFSDPEGDPKIALRLTSWTDLGFEDEDAKEPLIAQASAEVVEEIIDALALFSRRVNRDRPPVSLRFAAAVLDDEEIRDALQDAVRRGLGRKLSLGDGSKRWTIGPRVRQDKRMSGFGPRPLAEVRR